MTYSNAVNTSRDSVQQTMTHAEETDIYEEYLAVDRIQGKQAMNPNQYTNKTSPTIQSSQCAEGCNQACGRRKYMIIGIILGVVACVFSGASLCFAAIAWENALHTQDETQKMRVHFQDEDKKQQEEIRNLKERSHQVAGSAAFMAGGDQNPGAGEVIPFTTLQLNSGLHYDPLTSVFTCPVHGLYMFSFSLFSGEIGGPHYDDIVGGILMMDGVKVAEVGGRNDDPVHWQQHQAATTVVVDCPAGVKVWVQNRWTGVRISGTDDRPLSVFMGYAITFLDYP